MHNFIYEIIDTTANSKEELVMLEKYYILDFNTFKEGYNTTKGGEGISGFTHSEEYKKQMSLRMKNNKHSIGNTTRKGCTLSNETKEKLRRANLGKKLSDETKEK